MHSSEQIFELHNITYSYPGENVPVLGDISLRICRGEKICILGANGTGKSTLLKLLSGLIQHHSGSFKAFGTEITANAFTNPAFLSAYHQKVGFIFQNSDAQLFCSTVKEEISFGLLQLGLSPDEVQQRVQDVMMLLKISGLKDKTPFKLSGGEKKKVALASILVLNPQVLILDEPTNGLDPRTQRSLVELLNQLSNAGKTIITSTHNLELVQEISDRAVVFGEDHQIAKDAATREVFEDIDLLKQVNLVDEYYHRHGDGNHAHYHMHNY
ncbi:MAG: energy-coupling factor ABC transporter ATP-binding protein [Clostridia bacterium]|nr:energy-coupling factor ABC transporter ATP-binding protein [Clostridia bacterium]